MAQARIGVLPGDDAATLGQRVLAREHPLLVATLRWLAAGRLALGRDGVTLDGEPLSSPLQLDADNHLVARAPA